MHADLKNKIKARLSEAANLIDLNSQAHDLPSLQQRVLHLELQAEIEFLTKALTTSKTFANTFKQRCSKRETDKEQAVSFTECPQSATNKLYWDIANFLFQPKTQQAMLAILMPGVKHQVTVNIPETKLKNQRLKDFLNHVTPELSVTPLDGLKETPSLQDLSSYMIAKDRLLNMNEIAHFTLPLHASLHATLNHHYPQLAQKLYEHNHSLQTLAADISYYTDKAITPEKALQDLHKGLILGGERMTGQQDASASATFAIARFSAWFDTLPKALQNDLRTLTYDGHHTLGNIINDELNQGDCVETAAGHLISLLENNHKNPLLHLPPATTHGQLKALEKKYKGKQHTLDIQKEHITVSTFPGGLTKKAIQQLNIQSTEDLINLLIAFPPTHYAMLWQGITLPKPAEHLRNLADAIAQGFFNPEQKEALAQAVCRHHSTFEQLEESAFSWAIKTNDAIFLQKALENMTTKEKDNAIQQQDEEDNTVLHQTASNPQCLKIILGLYNEDPRMAAVKQKNLYGNTVLHIAASNPQSLKAILKLYPTNQRRKAVQQTNVFGDTVLYQAVVYPQSLKKILELLPKEQRLEAIQQEKRRGNTLLHRAAANPQSLKIILELYKKGHRLAAIQQENEDGDTVLHQATDNPESLKIILELYKKEQRLEVLQQKNEDDNTVVHRAATNPQSFKTILEFLPTNERLEAVKRQYQFGRTALHQAVANHDHQSLKEILELVPKEQRQDAVKQKNEFGETLLHKAVNHPQSLKAIVDVLSEGQSLALIQQEERLGDTVLHKAVVNPQSLKTILTLYPENQRLNVVKQENKDGDSILYQATANDQSLKAILDLLPKDQVLEVLQQENEEGDTLLHLAAANYDHQSLKAILELVPKEQRQDAVKQENEFGETLLHKAVMNPQSLTTILDVLPESQRLALVLHEDKFGETVLYQAAAHYRSLKAILDLLPTDQKQDAVKQSGIAASELVKKPEKKPDTSSNLGFFAQNKPKQKETTESFLKNRWAPK